MTAWRSALVAVVLVLAAATSVATGTAAAAAAAPAAGRPCYGAASRDPVLRCADPALRLTVAPTPAQALLVPYARCDVLSLPGQLAPCRFDDEREPVTDDVALVGDSHAGHWRAAMRQVTRGRHWRGTSLTKSGCPFTTARLALTDGRARACREWTSQVIAWLRRHREVHTVIVSNHAGARVLVPQGQDAYAAKVAGFQAAWRSLPTTVGRIVVIRDVPQRPLRTLDCVERAIARHQAAGTRCAAPRRQVLQSDPGAVAARHQADPRVRLIDLTPFFCSPRSCFPVIGGALVSKDAGHMTTAFSTSLGPYLLRAVDALIPRS